MKNFKKEFPNLKKHLLTGDIAKKYRYYADWMDIMDTCLDKQKVRETIERVCLQTGAEVIRDQLLIEFGLED